jgi:hypothetical protein
VSNKEEKIKKWAQQVSEHTRRMYAKMIMGPPLPTEKQFSTPGQGEGISDR